MSTRSVTGVYHPEIKDGDGNPEVGVGHYVHSDGYPEARLPLLKKVILRDGPKKAIETIMDANDGGWSYLCSCSEYTNNSLGESRAELVDGYGLKYLDAPGTKPIPHSEFVEEYGLEFAYYIDENTGDIHWFEQGDSTERVELFADYSKVGA